MAQTGIVSAPFPAPPGLDASNGAASPVVGAPAAAGAASAASQAARNDSAPRESQTRAWLDTRSEKQAIVDDVRRAVLEDVDAKVADKMKDLWARGNKMLKHVELESQQKNAKMQDELMQCRLKQDTLKAEHEELKAALAGMAQQFAMLGALFAGPACPKVCPPTPIAAAVSGTNGTAASTEVGNSSASASGSTLQDSPGGSSYAGGSLPPLPVVPDFPFPAEPAAVTPLLAAATPLSLAKSLGVGADTPSLGVPVSLMGSIPQATPGQKIFSFTLRKADGTDLGLNVSHHEEDKALRVEGVRAEGAVEAWNRQCIGSTSAEKAVMPGDRIVSVNGVINDPGKMLEECRDKQLLKITVVRGDAPPQASAASKNTTLRADASEFVPTGLNVIIEQPSKENPKEGANAAGNIEKAADTDMVDKVEKAADTENPQKAPEC